MLPHRSRTSVVLFLAPPLLLFGGGVLLPIVQSLFLSFFQWDGIFPMEFVGLENYRRLLFGDDIFWTAFGNQLLYLVICLVLQVGGGLLVASLLLTITKGREVFKVLYLMPAVISTPAIALLFQRIYGGDGLINTMLSAVGLDALARPWLSDVSTVLAAVSIPRAGASWACTR